MPPSVVLKDDRIVDRWSMLIGNGQGNADAVYRDTEQFIRDSQAPGISIERVQVGTEGLSGLFGQRRDYLLVTNEGIKDFRMYIGARDYGNFLDVSWYLTAEPRTLKSMMSSAMTRGESEQALSFALNVFQQQDLSAYATVVHRCLLRAVDSLLSDTGQDPSRIDRKSKGFLGISG